ncbi:MAG TPA: HAD-IIB family hydrolase [Labilithrix sp.]
MRPLATLDAGEAKKLRGLLFDLDDTLLTHGLLEREAYDALWDLKDAGVALVAVTGRPSGWGEVIARQWPIDGVIAENGAVFVVREGKGVSLLFDGGEDAARARRAKLDVLVDEVACAVPQAKLTDDVRARRTDVTWDVGERMQLDEASIATVVSLAHARGARTTRSSVHVHATHERDDKASGAVRFLVTRFGADASAALVDYAFVGDSGNDAACFAAFKTTFGVANVRASIGSLSVPPRFVASRERGAGFAELASTLVRARI